MLLLRASGGGRGAAAAAAGGGRGRTASGSAPVPAYVAGTLWVAAGAGRAVRLLHRLTVAAFAALSNAEGEGGRARERDLRRISAVPRDTYRHTHSQTCCCCTHAPALPPLILSWLCFRSFSYPFSLPLFFFFFFFLMGSHVPVLRLLFA